MAENQNAQPLDKQNGNGSQTDHGNEKDNDTVIPEEFLNELPPKDRKELIQSITRISGVFPRQNPIFKKVTSEHISDLIKHADENDKRDRTERQAERNYNFKILVTVLLSILLICGLLIYTKQTEFLKYLIGGIFGFGGGFGVGKFYNRD